MSETTKKAKSREAYREYAERALGISVESAIDKQRSKMLVNFYIQEIHNALRNEIDEDEVEEGLVDNSGDLGIDFIHKDDGQVLIIQSKYRGKKKAEAPDAFFEAVPNWDD